MIYWRSTHCRSSMSVCSDKTDEEIPFDPPIVSKFGPISRSCKTKYKSTDPVQATANQVISLSLPLFFSLMFFAALCTCMLTKQGFLIKWIFSEAIKINEHSPILSNVQYLLWSIILKYPERGFTWKVWFNPLVFILQTDI